jgi:hypothetical protein
MKLYIVTMKSGPDYFTEMVFAADNHDAKEVAEIRFDAECVNVRRGGR